MQGDIHKLGLGLLERIINEVGNDLNVNNLFETTKPLCEDMVKSYFPNPNVNIHPLAEIGYKFLTRDKVDRKVVDISKEVGNK